MPTFKCKHIGYDCSFEASAVSTDEVMKEAVEHVQKMHGVKDIPPEHMKQIRWAVEKKK